MTDQTALLDAPVIQFTTVSESRALVVIDQGPNLPRSPSRSITTSTAPLLPTYLANVIA